MAERRRARLLLALATLLLTACGGGLRYAPVDEVGVGDGTHDSARHGAGRTSVSPGSAPGPAPAASASGAPGVVVSTLPAEQAPSRVSDAEAASVTASRESARTSDTRTSDTGTSDTGTSDTSNPPTRLARAAPPPPAALKPAAAALVAEAEQRARAGDHDVAAARVERALQVEPGNAWLWHRLARERLAQGRSAEAENLAARSTSMAPGDSRLQAGNWRLIEAARRARGDGAGAARAAERAAALESGAG